MVSMSLIVEEEVGLVTLLIDARNVYRPSDSNAKLISVRIRLWRDRDAEMVGVKRGVTQIIVNITMQAVATGLGDHIDHISSAPTILCRERILLDLEFLNVVRRWNVDDAAPTFAHVPGSIEKERVGSEVAATKVKERNVLVRGALLSA